MAKMIMKILQNIQKGFFWGRCKLFVSKIMHQLYPFLPWSGMMYLVYLLANSISHYIKHFEVNKEPLGVSFIYVFCQD